MKQMRRIYLDFAAGFANPSSLHAEGVSAARRLAAARQKIAEILAARPAEIIFTSGGTESNNLAIFGLESKHIITTKIEHASVLEPARRLKTTFLPVSHEGLVDLQKLKKSLRRDTTLVSIIYAHNEIGVIQPVREIVKIIRRFRQKNNSKMPYLHLDACQAPRFLDLNVQRLGVDLITLNGGKLGVPGAGCLFVRRGVPLKPMVFGGGQENGRRAGTENVAGIINFARALAQAQKERERISKKLTKLRNYFISELLRLPDTSLNGSRDARLPNNVNISFVGLLGEQIVLELDAKGIACSTGAACSIPARNGPSAIIDAVRFTFGPETKKRDLDRVLRVLPPILKKLNSVKNLNKII